MSTSEDGVVVAKGSCVRMRDVCGMRERLHRLANGEVVRLPEPETEHLLSSVDGLTANVANARKPVAELRAWALLLVALTDQLVDGPLEPGSPRDRVLRTMIGKAAGLAATALPQVVSLLPPAPVGDLVEEDL